VAAFLSILLVLALGCGPAWAQRTPEPRGARLVSGFEPGHGFVSWFPSGLVSTDRSEARFGRSSLRIASDGDARPVAAEWALADPLDARGASWRLWVRVDAPDALRELHLQTTGDDWSSYRVYRLERRLRAQDGGVWLALAALASEGYRVGAPEAGAIDRIRLRVADDGTRPVVVHVDRLALVERRDRGAVSITFDDGWADQARHAVPAMRARGWAGTLYVIPSLAGSPERLRRTELRDLAAEGWEVGGHDHPSLEVRGEDPLDVRLDEARAFVDAFAAPGDPRTYAYPQGDAGASRVVPAVGRRFDAARTIDEGLESLPPADPLRLRAMTLLPTTKLAHVEAALDDAARERGWLILVVHRLDPSGGRPTLLPPDRFEAVLNLVEASGLAVLPVREVLRSLRTAP
jgi:peptidoglycan/xylan/chitin deacetylase (PgdA/CDA1 family)